MAESELAAKLSRQNQINEGDISPSKVSQSGTYAEFKEFSFHEIKEFRKTFNKYDVDRSNYLNFMELKLMMEKLNAPQTHLALKAMIKEVDEDLDGEISFREFMLIFRKAKMGELEDGSGLYDLVSEIDVDVEGVRGAKNFFQAKIDTQTKSNKFEQEIKEEQLNKQREAEEAAERKKAFKAKANMFQ